MTREEIYRYLRANIPISAESADACAEALSIYDDTKIEILVLYAKGYTQKEIAKKLGCCQQNIAKIILNMVVKP